MGRTFRKAVALGGAALALPTYLATWVYAGLAGWVRSPSLPHSPFSFRHSPVYLARVVLSRRYLPAVLAVLAVVLGLPTLWLGWRLEDDLLQRVILSSASLTDVLSRLFVFLDPRTNRALMDTGVLPWWTLESVRVSFLRPLAAFSLWVDYRLWPDAPVLMHAHNVLWYGGLCALATLVYRRLLGLGLAAGIAALLFVVSATHIGSIAALDARNVLQSASLGLLALGLHDRWRREGWRVGGVLAPLCLALALLGAEAGVAIVAYLGAYALCLERGPLRHRLCSLLPYGLVIVVWRLAYQALGYGAWASSFYVDPGREPLRFVLAVLERGPALLLGQWAMPDPGVYAILSAASRRAYWLVAVLFMALLGAVLYPLLRSSRVARFWGLGMLLATVPVCAVNPASGRHLILVGLGAMGLLAQFVAGLGERQGWVWRGAGGSPHGQAFVRAWQRTAWAAGLLLLGLQGVVYPILMRTVQTGLNSFYQAAMDIGSLPDSAQQDVVIVNAPSPGQFIYVPSLRDYEGQPMPAHLRILAPGYCPVVITRVDTQTLLVQPQYGYLLAPGEPVGDRRDILPLAHPSFASQYGDGFFRSGDFPLALGQQIELTGMRAEVTALTDDGRPATARMMFSRPLEDPSLRWLAWDWERNAYVPFTPPAVGATVRVAGPF